MSTNNDLRLDRQLGSVRLIILIRPQVHTFRVCSDSIRINHERSFPRDRLTSGETLAR